MGKAVTVIALLVMVCGLIYVGKPNNDNVVCNGSLLSNVDGTLSIGANFSTNRDYDYIVTEKNKQKGLVLEKGKSAFVPIGFNTVTVNDLEGETLRLDFK
ncbi:hypothetical protein SAMN02745136_00520 [Anaerocolumna jejuensis DSM 15929]|uniref:Uncharacterized protein n=1 Tax=Anaerocolumna jejuensis DSM 15929 TaxID=1121322 RepID=A0A1M6KNR6_9FIRM|nr:hypothetical protein [Anaerocolumna jejuensis]SHJ60524.1 hypothetical protein SAMN02745136_00520 [Anaerocolumna jejuensis DSM 15929]